MSSTPKGLNKWRKPERMLFAHMNTTIDGTIGAETAFTLEDAAVRVQEICDAAKAQNPDVICLSHSGPIAKPPDAAFINEHTDTVGVCRCIQH